MDDDLQILTLPFNNDLYSVCNKANNLKVIILLILQYLLVVINWILSFVFPIVQHNLDSFSISGWSKTKPDLLNSYNLVIYSQIILWLLTHLIKYYLENNYYRKLRILGYYHHHGKVQKHVKFPSFVVHVVNALLLLATTILSHINDVNLGNFHLKPIHVAQIIITIASVSVLVNIKIHIYHEVQFRRHRNPPDVFCVDDPSRRLTSDGLNQVAIRSSSFLEDLLENQADMIYNLKLQNTHLRELLYKATQQQQQQQNDTSNNQENVVSSN